MTHKHIKLSILLAFPFILTAKEVRYLTILVHGTLKPPEYSFSSFLKIMRNKIDNSIYAKAMEYVRKDSTLYGGQPIQGEGLIAIEIPDGIPLTDTQLTAKILHMQHIFLDKDSQHSYYTFGWNGLLSVKKRYEAAVLFYKDLANEVARLEKEGITPHITVYTFSHGAGVALNLAAVKSDNPLLKPNAFSIDRLVMLGAPVQKTTDYLMNDSLFKEVYHFYSTQDNIQTMDIFSPKQFFSKRLFTNRKNFKIPKKLRQIRIKTIKKNNIWKDLYYDHSHLFDLLSKRTNKPKHRDPKHTEFWHFEWGSDWYRPNFPLNPLPLVTFLPVFIHALEQTLQTCQEITFDFSLSHAGAIITSNKDKLKIPVPILNHEKIAEIFTAIGDHTTSKLQPEYEDQQLTKALNQAKQDLKYKKHKKRRLFSHFLHKYMPLDTRNLFFAL